jgi:RIO-like serine/threonine protein kinase
MNLPVAQQFRIGPQIGVGNNAVIYTGTSISTGEVVALKLEPLVFTKRHLENEHKVYKTLGAQGTWR